mgnify:CR=1 FL=1
MATPTNLANIYSAGLWNVGSYQVSGMPFCSGSINVQSYGADGVKIEFPYVTSWIQIFNNCGNWVNVGFSQNGVKNDNFFTVQRWYGSQGGRNDNCTTPLPLKVTELWLSASTMRASSLTDSISIVAGLTNIPVSRVTAISPSGSNWSGSVGVG